MAFAVTISKQTYMGDLKVVFGKWVTDTTTGEIDLSPYFSGKIYHVDLTMKDAAAVADAPAIDETFPLHSGTALTLLITSGKDGYFIAWGEGV